MKYEIELKKYFISLILGAGLICSPVFAVQYGDGAFDAGVEKYRSGDVYECQDIMQHLKKKDPSNSYVIYYLAMSDARLGDFSGAKENYEQVIMLNQEPELVSYAKEGIRNIDNALSKQGIQLKAEKKKEKSADKPPTNADAPVKTASVSGAVSDDEVAKAIKVLKEAGLLNVQLGVGSGAAVNNPLPALQQNSDLMNMSMMMGTMGGNSKSSGMDMLPFLMMQQQQGGNGAKSNISPEVIQMMMNNSMLDGLSNFDLDNKDK
jgi:tetratricopeptide (TPR) repeat protein